MSKKQMLKMNKESDKSSNVGLRIQGFMPVSWSNGPGKRSVLWVQGCTLKCLGCFNPETHSALDGELVSTDRIASWVMIAKIRNRIEGLTVSGGEPLQQSGQLIELFRKIGSHTKVNIILFTGFTKDELERMPCYAEITTLVDVIIAGRYIQSQRVATGLLGSTNKELLFFSNRYQRQDFKSIPEAEVLLAADGTVELTGIDPLQLR